MDLSVTGFNRWPSASPAKTVSDRKCDDLDARQPPQKPGAGRDGSGCHPRPHWPWQGTTTTTTTTTVTTVVTLDGELPSQL